MDKKYIFFLAFYKSDPSTSDVTLIQKIGSKLIDMWEGCYIVESIYYHVEILIEDPDGMGSFSSALLYDTEGNIVYDGVRKQMFKKYTLKDCKDFRRVEVSKSNYMKCHSFLQDKFDDYCKYDRSAFYRFAAGPFKSCFPQRKNTYTCASLVCEALRIANVFPADINSDEVTTQMIFNRAKDFTIPYSDELEFLTEKWKSI